MTEEFTVNKMFARKHANEIVEQIAGTYPDSLETTFESLNLDSLDLAQIEVLVAVELEIEDIAIDFVAIKTVGDLANLIEKKLSSGASSALANRITEDRP